MIRYREPLDAHIPLPEAMEAYLSYHGWHFSPKLCAWAVNQMSSEDDVEHKEKKIDAWSKDKCESLLAKYKVNLENNVEHDFVFVTNMGVADYLGGSIPDELHLAKYVKQTIDDVDQADGFILSRFWSDCSRKGLPIPWEDVL